MIQILIIQLEFQQFLTENAEITNSVLNSSNSPQSTEGERSEKVLMKILFQRAQFAHLNVPWSNSSIILVWDEFIRFLSEQFIITESQLYSRFSQALLVHCKQVLTSTEFTPEFEDWITANATLKYAVLYITEQFQV